MHYVGLDAHLKQSTYCLLDGNGQRLRSRTIHGDWKVVVRELADLPKPFVVCFEASVDYGVLFEQLSRIAERVVVAHPGQLRLIFRSKRKNDRVDAEKLAKLLFLGEVPAVYVPSLEVRAWRRLIRHRRSLVAQRVAAKNAIRALLRGEGILAARSLWSQKGLRWLQEQELGTEMGGLQRDMLVERLQSLTRMIERVEQVLDKVAAGHPGVRLLKTIPGVGRRTGEAVVAAIDDPSRFSNLKAIGSYFGLVPCQDASAKVNRLGHITGDGPPLVRCLLVEAAWAAKRRSGQVRRFFDRVVRGDPERRKIAAVATAHYLLRIMLTMLRTGEVWREAAA
jgi:transposase